jgi:hypothetical protein
MCVASRRDHTTGSRRLSRIAVYRGLIATTIPGWCDENGPSSMVAIEYATKWLRK